MRFVEYYCSIWRNFNWRSASLGHAATTNLLVTWSVHVYVAWVGTTWHRCCWGIRVAGHRGQPSTPLSRSSQSPADLPVAAGDRRWSPTAPCSCRHGDLSSSPWQRAPAAVAISTASCSSCSSASSVAVFWSSSWSWGASRPILDGLGVGLTKMVLVTSLLVCHSVAK